MYQTKFLAQTYKLIYVVKDDLKLDKEKTLEELGLKNNSTLELKMSQKKK